MLRHFALFTALFMLLVTIHAPAATTRWDFETPTNLGTPPAGWVDASQSGSPATYRVESFQSSGALYIRTAGNTWNRVKVRTTSNYTTGRYEWRVHLPSPLEAGSSSAVAGFLYSPQSSGSFDVREIDFEIGYGTSAERSAHGIPPGALMCYMTIQRDDSSGTPHSSMVFEPLDSADQIEPGHWYTISMVLTADAQGRYVVSWYIQKDDRPEVKARPDFTAGYGPANSHATDFRIYCSVENFSNLWIGDNQPAEDHEAWFDHVMHQDITIPPSTGELITDIESDTTSAGFPPGADGEWTRFGAAYGGIDIDTHSDHAAAGTNSLHAVADFGAGSSMGVEYNIPGSSLDVSGGPAVSYSARQLGAGSPLVRLKIVETDGDIWVAPYHLPSTAYETYRQDLVPANLTIADASGGGDLDLQLDRIGFDIDANGATSGTCDFHFDEIYWNADATPAGPALPEVTSVESPDSTTGAFPPDPGSSGFPGTTVEGEWTRFGAAYSSISIIEDAANSPDGDRYLSVGANFAAGSRVGVRYLPYGQPVDWSGYDALHFSLRASAGASGTSFQFALFESDGDIWVSSSSSLPSGSWQAAEVRLASGLSLDPFSTGDGSLDLSQIVLIGWNFDNTEGTGSQLVSLDKVYLTADPAQVHDWLILY